MNTVQQSFTCVMKEKVIAVAKVKKTANLDWYVATTTVWEIMTPMIAAR